MSGAGGDGESRPASDWPEDPYPGTWPHHSYVVDDDAVVHRVEPDAQAPSGWVVRSGPRTECLDAWLGVRGRPPLAGRTAVLSFGSNRCPAKVVRQGAPLLNLHCTADGLAAVWSHGTRGDGQVVATLVDADGHQDEYFVSMCTEQDVAVLDQVEGRGTGYDLVELEPERIVLEDGTSPEEIVAYVGLHPHRWPVAGEDGLPIVLNAMTQDDVARWRADAVHWEPAPEAGPFGPLGPPSGD
ncbi:hypothetical protein ACHAAC_07975 [Aeromicrobium sp. CF4.19]|uniref:hypothetical protein n=1 Tax=Aeromicrobium sp. CF4.19 TaxID=3373082 RepID=UPI003EE5330F